MSVWRVAYVVLLPLRDERAQHAGAAGVTRRRPCLRGAEERALLSTCQGRRSGQEVGLLRPGRSDSPRHTHHYHPVAEETHQAGRCCAAADTAPGPTALHCGNDAEPLVGRADSGGLDITVKLLGPHYVALSFSHPIISPHYPRRTQSSYPRPALGSRGLAPGTVSRVCICLFSHHHNILFTPNIILGFAQPDIKDFSEPSWIPAGSPTRGQRRQPWEDEEDAALSPADKPRGKTAKVTYPAGEDRDSVAMASVEFSSTPAPAAAAQQPETEEVDGEFYDQLTKLKQEHEVMSRVS